MYHPDRRSGRSSCPNHEPETTTRDRRTRTSASARSAGAALLRPATVDAYVSAVDAAVPARRPDRRRGRGAARARCWWSRPTTAPPATWPGDLKAFLAPRAVHVYPSRGTTFESHLDPPPHLAGLRIAAMNAMADPAARSSSPARSRWPRRSPTRSCGPRRSRSTRGESVDLDDVTLLLADAGYDRTDQVEERGQFAVRGGILDVYPATEEQAIRVELFGDEIESMRRFSVFTQRSLGRGRAGRAAPAAELSAEHRGRSRSRRASSLRSTWCRPRRSW